MRAILAALLILSATAAEARYVRGWVWQPDHRLMQIRRWDLRGQERDAADFARHCRVMRRLQPSWLVPFGCR